MQVSVAAIREEKGKSLAVRLTDDGFTLDWGAAPVSVSAPLELDATLTNTGKAILLRGQVCTRLRLVCNRCLASFDLPVCADLEEEFFRAAPGEEGPANRWPGDEDNVYSGDVIDLTPAVQQNLILTLPIKAVCDAACKGLCPHCGVNLNERDCGCRPQEVHPRLAALAELLKD